MEKATTMFSHMNRIPPFLLPLHSSQLLTSSFLCFPNSWGCSSHSFPMRMPLSTTNRAVPGGNIPGNNPPHFCFCAAETEVLKQLSSMGRLVVCAWNGAVQSSANLLCG